MTKLTDQEIDQLHLLEEMYRDGYLMTRSAVTR